MKVSVTIDGSLRQQMAELGPKMLDGSNRATERQTKETQQTMRTEITRGLSARAANALRNEWFYNPGPAGTQLVGFLYSAWRRKPRSGGADIDLLSAYETGAVIRPVRGKYLAVALPAAYSTVGGRSGAKGRGRPTPKSVEAALSTKLFMVQKPGHLPVLAAKDVSVAGGARVKIRAARFTNRKGAISRRRTSSAIIPMFVLLRNVNLPKRVDFGRIEQDGVSGLEDKLIIELAGRGVLS